MSTTTSSETTIRTITFSGKKEDWRMWSRRFEAFAETRGYSDALTTELAHLPKDGDVLDPTEATYEEKKNARKINREAYGALILACTDKTSFGAIDEARTDDNPKGVAHKAWKSLKERFEPEDQTSEIEILDKLNNCKLDDEKDNIDDWFPQLIHLKQRAKTIKLDILENQIIAHVLHNLPAAYKEYKAVILKEARDKTLSLTKMQELLRTAHKQNFGENTTNKNQGFIASYGNRKNNNCYKNNNNKNYSNNSNCSNKFE
jgi:gag-polypeptide of LTR copia-type